MSLTCSGAHAASCPRGPLDSSRAQWDLGRLTAGHLSVRSLQKVLVLENINKLTADESGKANSKKCLSHSTLSNEEEPGGNPARIRNQEYFLSPKSLILT